MNATTETESVRLAHSAPSERLNWAERHGWWILSLCLHLLVLTWFTVAREPQPLAASYAKRVVILPAERTAPSAAAQPALPEGEAPAEEGVDRSFPAPPDGAAFAVARRTVAEISETSRKGPADPAAVPETPAPQPEPTESDQEARIRELLAQHSRTARRSARSAAQDQIAIDVRLHKAEVTRADEPPSQDPSGLGQGPVRTINFGNIDPPAEQEVMRRYGIRRERRLVNPGQSSYLNSLSVGGVEYGVPREAGISDVIALPERAVRKMIALEQTWLVARGYDPRVTQVRRVEFGAVKQPDGKWDLGILDIDVQDLRGVFRGEGR